MNPNALLVEQSKVVPCLLGVVPATSTPARVSLKHYLKVTFLILVKNAGAGVAGSAVTLKQATSVAGGGEKPVPFVRYHANLDTAASDSLTEQAAGGNTFTTDATVGKSLLYAVEVRPDDLDADGGFDCVRVGTGDATAATVTVIALLWPARFGGLPTPSAVTD